MVFGFFERELGGFMSWELIFTVLVVVWVITVEVRLEILKRHSPLFTKKEG